MTMDLCSFRLDGRIFGNGTCFSRSV